MRWKGAGPASSTYNHYHGSSRNGTYVQPEVTAAWELWIFPLAALGWEVEKCRLWREGKEALEQDGRINSVKSEWQEKKKKKKKGGGGGEGGARESYRN